MKNHRPCSWSGPGAAGNVLEPKLVADILEALELLRGHVLVDLQVLPTGLQVLAKSNDVHACFAAVFHERDLKIWENGLERRPTLTHCYILYYVPLLPRSRSDQA